MDKSTSGQAGGVSLARSGVRAALITVQALSFLLFLFFSVGFYSSVSSLLAEDGGGLSVETGIDAAAGDVLIRVSGMLRNQGVLPASITLRVAIIGEGGESIASDSFTKRLGPGESSNFTLTLRLPMETAGQLLGGAAEAPFRLGFEYRSILDWVGVGLTIRGGGGS